METASTRSKGEQAVIEPPVHVRRLLSSVASCRYPHPLVPNCLERSAILASKRRFLAGHRLPALNHHVYVSRVELQAVADSTGRLGRRERCPAAEERLIDQLTGLGVVQNRSAHQLNRLLCWMIELLFIRATHDELRRWRTPDCRVLAWLPEPRCVFLSHIPAGLMLEPIVRSCEHCPALVPDDLLMVQRADPQQAIEDLSREL